MKQALVRAAHDKDADAIGLIHIQSWQKAYELYIPETILNSFSVTERAEFWRDVIKKGTHVLVLELDNNIVGFASICTFRGPKDNKSTGEISAIYINPKYWRSGYGTQLCLSAVEELTQKGYKEVLLWVLADNTLARSFYEKLGFASTNETKLEEFYEGGALLKEILYRKTL